MFHAFASHGIPARGLLHAARGFVLWFWGAGLALLLSSGAVSFRALDGSPVPSHSIGCLLLVGGVVALRRPDAGPLRIPGYLWVPVLLNLYFAPFVAWWIRVPYSGFLVGNVLAAAAAALWMLSAMCREAARAGRILGAAEFAREALWGARICGPMAGVILLGLAAWTGVRAAWFGTSLYGEWFEILFHLPRGIAVLGVLPFTIAMACAWRARVLCLQALPSAGPVSPDA